MSVMQVLFESPIKIFCISYMALSFDADISSYDICCKSEVVFAEVLEADIMQHVTQAVEGKTFTPN